MKLYAIRDKDTGEILHDFRGLMIYDTEFEVDAGITALRRHTRPAWLQSEIVTLRVEPTEPCEECKEPKIVWKTDEWGEDYFYEEERNFCPNCGRRLNNAEV